MQYAGALPASFRSHAGKLIVNARLGVIVGGGNPLINDSGTQKPPTGSPHKVQPRRQRNVVACRPAVMRNGEANLNVTNQLRY